MKKGGGKQKGSEFERWVCKKLSLAMSNGKRDDLYWRSAMSGGRASVKFKKGGKNLTQVGDITCIDKLGSLLTDKYVIECKRYKSVKWNALIYGVPQKGSIIEFWKQVRKDAKKAKKHPMLIVKENGRETMVCCLSPHSQLISLISSNEFCFFDVFKFSDFLTEIKSFL
tara:strand:+ start:11330 stop:11836 length:507 start_codon:yes stop_codon:yes gene_type:complete